MTVSPTFTSPLPIEVPPREKVVAEFSETVRLPTVRLVSDFAVTFPLTFLVTRLSGAAGAGSDGAVWAKLVTGRAAT